MVEINWPMGEEWQVVLSCLELENLLFLRGFFLLLEGFMLKMWVIVEQLYIVPHFTIPSGIAIN